MSILSLASDIVTSRPGQKLSFILAFISIGLYINIAFFLQRTETGTLLISYSIIFFLYLALTRSVLSFNFLLGFGILFRLIFLFSVPNLSDDFNRFFWDGVLIDNQINPFLFLPREIMDNPSISISALNKVLFESLNSPDYFTVYPPICQFVFWISASLSGGNLRIAVLIMKIFMFLAELGSIYLIIKLLKIHKIRREFVLFYILNPLVIIELVGNIHFEAFLIFFVLLAAYFIQNKRLVSGSFAFAFAIASKLTPILMLPFFLKRLRIKNAFLFYVITMAVTVLTFLPFIGSALISGLSSSIGLYFQTFEFNASIFYVIREIGFWIKGWDIIQIAGKWLALNTVIIILITTFFENAKTQNIPGIFLWPLFIYFAFASIIHPWYVTPLVAFSLFSNYRFPILWSFTIFLSYSGYGADGFKEHLSVLLVEYLAVYGYMIYEILKNKDIIKIKNPWPDII